MRQPLRSWVPTLCLVALLGCAPGNEPSDGNPPQARVGLEPATAALLTGGTQRFTATVTGSSETAVRWTSTGGDITGEGVYTAPAIAGTYTVRATSVADASSYAESSVTVTAPPVRSPPMIGHLVAAPSTIDPGQSTTLNWEVVGATSLSLEPEVGTVTGSRVSVSPAKTTTYTLRATNDVGSVTASVTVTVTVPPDTWASLGWAHELPGNYDSDVYRWLDSGRQQRTAVLTRNDSRDPGGSYGGMLRQFRFRVGTQERVSTGTGASGLWNGWGYVVSHYGNTVAYSANIPGNHRRVFVGRHHAVHEFSWSIPISGIPVKVTVHWFFSTGRDHPVYAVTFDTSAAGPGGLPTNADSRTPYGDIAWDGDGTNAWVDGVKWGDKYRFFSRDEPLTDQSRWDYRQLNAVPYTLTYSRSADAEMGMVQTLDWLQHNTGGTWFHDNWGHASEDRVNASQFGSWLMPPNWNWPYQMCQYEMGNTQPTRSKRLAWGLMYGAVGSLLYGAYGNGGQLSGHPHQSYSVFMVMGRQSAETVLAQATQVERMLRAQLVAIRGSLVSEGPPGVARADTARYPVAGYNSTYAAYELQPDVTGQFTVTLNAAGGDIQNPVFLVHKEGGVPGRVYLDGVPLIADLDYFASSDASTGVVWLTLNRVWSGSHTLSTGPGNGLK
ncbi:hypothetical protein JRI60_13260 [Archangium violaceum]|uniref:Ig-like domain-containing protein n=1 Tax=Archangium violaceum TaxID=83451 RepID=UPI00194F944A|nr:hypothetical protein [Archangium violaceum]QRN99923.1 hypothetical protein JRI60_13260 [Archangium violaceum]